MTERFRRYNYNYNLIMLLKSLTGAMWTVDSDLIRRSVLAVAVPVV